jgi:hypothetical protein
MVAGGKLWDSLNYYLNVYFKESFDGGATWTSSAAIPGVAHARDMAATMDDNGTSVALFICSDQFDGDSGNGSWVLFSQHPQGGSWTAPVEIQSGTMHVARRMPSVVRTKPNEYLFAYGYEDDLGGYFSSNDTKVRSFRWNGNTSTRDSETDTNLTEQADRPIISQQVGYDPYPDNMLYLFFQGAYDNEEFGDLFVMRGDYPSSWWHSGSAALVVVAPPSQRTAQGYLFRRNEYPTKDYVLILAMEAGPVSNPTANALIMRHADTLYALNIATDVTLETTLKFPTDSFSRYRTVYAAQDYAGHIHVVFQDYANTIKWVKINSSDYSVGPVQTLTTNQWLDSISVGQNKLYVSTISDVLTENNSASIIEVSF